MHKLTKTQKTLASDLRAKIAKWSPGESAYLNETHEHYLARLSESLQAASLAHYAAEYLSVDKSTFLENCGVRHAQN